MQNTTNNRVEMTGWHVKNWNALGWLETAIKLGGIASAAVGAVTMVGSEGLELSGVDYGVVAVAVLLSLGAVFQLVLRVKQKELISLVFAVVNLSGHAALLWVVVYASAASWVPVAFGSAYVVGELIKQRFLAASGYTEDGQTPAGMQRLSRIVAGVNALLVVLALLS